MARKRKNKNFLNFKPEINISKETRNKIIGTLLVFFSIFLIVSFSGQGGSFGEKYVYWMKYLFGIIAYVFPIFMGYCAYILFQEEYENSWQIYLSSTLIIIGLCGLLAMFPWMKDLGGVTGAFMYAQLTGVLGSIVTFFAFLAITACGGWLLWPHLGLEERLFELQKNNESSSLKKIFEPKFDVQKIPGIRGGSDVKVIKKKKKEDDSDEMKIKKSVIIKETDYKFPILDLLEKEKGRADSGNIKDNSMIIKRTLRNFNIPVEVSEVNVGPSVTQYAVKPAEGVNISKIAALTPNLSLELSAHPLRIEAPIPGRPLVGIEIPNKQKSIVRIRSLLENEKFQNPSSNLLMALGKNVSGEPIFADLVKMPHMLVAGATGSGKTICLNELLVSLLYLNSPNTMRLILVDPKRVEFSLYKKIPHLLTDVIYDAPKTLTALKWLTGEMDRRFERLGEAGARNIQGYNKLMAKKGEPTMPYIVFVVDELADLMLKHGKELEAGIVRIAQLARAAGIHMILATQRPSVNVITGLIKANIPARVGFRVASQIDSRTILDMAGAEKLLGFGDMLFLSAQSPKPKRLQGAFVSEEEVEAVVNYIEEQEEESSFKENDDLSKDFAEGVKKMEEEARGPQDEDKVNGNKTDPMYEEAKRVVLETGKASTSFLQRKLRLGYARAARLIDILEQNGVIGPGQGAKPREVYGDIDLDLDNEAPDDDDVEELDDDEDNDEDMDNDEDNDEKNED